MRTSKCGLLLAVALSAGIAGIHGAETSALQGVKLPQADRPVAAQTVSFDLAKHTIETVEIPVPPKLKELFGWMKDYHLFDNVLRFEGLKSEIRVARSASMRLSVNSGLERAGFNPETLRIQWLDPGGLIWLKWGTFPEGHGCYSKQGHLILQFDGHSLIELFRDSIYAHGSAGALDSSCINLDISYDPSAAGLELLRTEVQRDSSEKEGLFLDSEWKTDQGNTIYYGERQMQTVWRYRIENGKLRFASSERFLELRKDYPLPTIADALRVSVEKLRRINPNLKACGHASGRILLDDAVGPYQHERDDGICGDKPCPGE